MTGYNKIIIREWVNRATKVGKGSQLDILSQQEMLERELNYDDSLELNGGFTPLHYASYHGNPKMIDLLIAAGADIYAENEQNINVLHVAAQGDAPYSLAFFLRHSNLHISTKDKSQSTPLHWACISHSHQAVRYLLAWNAEVNATDMAGYTPLHLALRDFEFDQSKSLSTLRLLLNYDAKLDIRDQNYQIPEDYIKTYTDISVQRAVHNVIKQHTSTFNILCCKSDENSGLTGTVQPNVGSRSSRNLYPRQASR